MQFPIRFFAHIRGLFFVLTFLFSVGLTAQSKSIYNQKTKKTPTLIVHPNESVINRIPSPKDSTKTGPHKKPKKKPAATIPNRLKRPGSTVIHRQDAFEKKP